MCIKGNNICVRSVIDGGGFLRHASRARPIDKIISAANKSDVPVQKFITIRHSGVIASINIPFVIHPHARRMHRVRDDVRRCRLPPELRLDLCALGRLGLSIIDCINVVIMEMLAFSIKWKSRNQSVRVVCWAKCLSGWRCTTSVWFMIKIDWLSLFSVGIEANEIWMCLMKRTFRFLYLNVQFFLGFWGLFQSSKEVPTNGSLLVVSFSTFPSVNITIISWIFFPDMKIPKALRGRTMKGTPSNYKYSIRCPSYTQKCG